MPDLRLALRLLRQTPGFTAAAVIILALGIGLNTTMFSLIHALAFSARPFPDAGRVVQLYTHDLHQPTNYRAFSYPAYREIRARSDLFAGVLAHNLTIIGLGDGAETRRTFTAIVSSNYFQVLGVPLIRGRGFTAEEELPAARRSVVVASHLYWKRTGYAPDLVGSTVMVNEQPFTVVGIAPEGFTGTTMLLGPELYFPLGEFDRLTNDFHDLENKRTLERPDAFNLFLVARLQPGVTAEAARSALRGVAASLEALDPVHHREKTFSLGPLPRLSTSTSPSDESSIRLLGLVFLGMAAAVLLIVCLNLAGLLLARGHARRREFAIRLALGGTRGRIIRQLLTEGMVLSLAGGALGFGLAVWAADLLIGSLAVIMPVAVFFAGPASWVVVVATFGFCALATLGFAFGPALKLSGADILTDLKQQAGEDRREIRSRRFPRHPLVVAQIALSLALLIAAGLFIRLAHRAAHFDPGYRADDTLMVEVDASMAGYDEPRALQTYRKINEQLAALPGVQSSSIGALAPFGFIHLHRSVQRAGATSAPDTKPATAAEGRAFGARWNSIGADYFATMGLPLLRGRAFTAAETDGTGAPAVAIIDEGLARKLWPDDDALGQRIQWAEQGADRSAAQDGDPASSAGERNRAAAARTLEVVGIVGATRERLSEKDPRQAVYVPFAQGFMSNAHFHVRPEAGISATALIDAVRQKLRTTAPGVPVFKVRTFAQHREASMEIWAVRTGSILFTSFGAMALLVAVIGIYGIKAYAVSRRTREIGIRRALGAEAKGVQTMILREGLAMTLFGVALGLLLGAGVGRILAGVFHHLDAFDLTAFALAATGLTVAAILACWLPARRATRVNPVEALRSD
jgi:predicted permease